MELYGELHGRVPWDPVGGGEEGEAQLKVSGVDLLFVFLRYCGSSYALLLLCHPHV